MESLPSSLLLSMPSSSSSSIGVRTTNPSNRTRSTSGRRNPKRLISFKTFLVIVVVVTIVLGVPSSSAFTLTTTTNMNAKQQRFSSHSSSSSSSTRRRRTALPTSSSSLKNDNEDTGGGGEENIKVYPKLIVFDLDNTLWTPELYQLRNKSPKMTKIGRDFIPQAGKHVNLFDGARRLLLPPPTTTTTTTTTTEDASQDIDKNKQSDRHNEYLPTTRPEIALGIASRTKSVEWAHALLGQWKLTSIMRYVEIFPGSKKQHFSNIQKSSGGELEYKDMLFFDDARDGKYGNCEPVANMGCLAVHTPHGLTTVDIFHHAMDQYHIWRTEHKAIPGCIVEADGTLSFPPDGSSSDEDVRQVGIIKLVKDRYGFITYRNGPVSRDLFFPLNAVMEGPRDGIKEGTSVTFIKRRDPRNEAKWVATDVRIDSTITATASSSSNKNMDTDEDLIEFKCFSMNQPFAALLTNGFKTLETRNGTMFERYPPGSQVLLHVGQRLYPDENRHLEILKRTGKDENEIRRLKQMPIGFGKGNIVAILELGRTYLTTLEERSQPDHENKVTAYGCDSGQYATEIQKVSYLKRPIPMKGQAGLFKVRIPKDAIPDGWSSTAPQSEMNRNVATTTTTTKERTSFVASISS